MTIASCVLLVLACASAPPAPPLTAVRSRDALVAGLSRLARERRERCGCAGPVVDLWLDEALRMTYEDSPSLDAVASAACLDAVEQALATGCRTVAIPEECDIGRIAAVPTPTMFVGKGASCNYAICARGLVCRGEEESECVPGQRPIASTSVCARAYDLPPFAP